MRRVAVCLALAVLALSPMGCVLSFDVKRCPHHKQVIELDGELYVVDVKTQRVRKIALDSGAEVETTIETEVEIADD